jgi:hypothetical protein
MSGSDTGTRGFRARGGLALHVTSLVFKDRLADADDSRRLRDPDVQLMSELCLDFHQAHSGHNHKFPFLVTTHDQARARYLMRLLERIDDDLGGTARASLKRQVRFAIPGGREDQLHGYTWYSWAVFCDPALLDVEAPRSLIRSIERDDDGVWNARDRDGDRVLSLTDAGASLLMERSICPITCRRSSSVSPVTYPGWHREETRLILNLRLRKAFDR